MMDIPRKDQMEVDGCWLPPSRLAAVPCDAVGELVALESVPSNIRVADGLYAYRKSRNGLGFRSGAPGGEEVLVVGGESTKEGGFKESEMPAQGGANTHHRIAKYANNQSQNAKLSDIKRKAA
jgi:hypothetical protein